MNSRQASVSTEAEPPSLNYRSGTSKMNETNFQRILHALFLGNPIDLDVYHSDTDPSKFGNQLSTCRVTEACEAT